MSSRDAILKSVRLHLPEASPLPDLDGPWITFPDPAAQFARILEMIGGCCLRAPDLATLRNELALLPQLTDAPHVICEVPGLDFGGKRLDSVVDPHDLADVDVAILPGEFAVAENAAVWITDAAVRHRVIYFLCQHLVLVVPASQVVNNLGEAYQRIQRSGVGFGAFIAGPSKTADIEQSLVIGAHGPRSMTVCLVG